MSPSRPSQPRISVLLPTAVDDRPWLPNAIDSVLDQSFENVELVISDDGSAEADRGAIETGARDPRVRVVRPRRPAPDRRAPITENWNAAVRASSGDYLLLLGDDDALMLGSLERLAALLDDHDGLECLSFDGYRFVAADSIPGSEGSFFGPIASYPRQGVLSPSERRGVVRDFFRFELGYQIGYMQLALVARSAVARLPGDLFKPPFPDFYSFGALLLTAETWLHVPEHHAIMGISPASFASKAHQGLHDEGAAYLGERVDFPGSVPGNALLNGLYVWLQVLQRDFPEELGDVRPDRGQYLTRAVWSWYRKRAAGSLSTAEFVRRLRGLGPRDWASLTAGFARGSNLRYLASTHRHRRKLESHLLFSDLQPLEGARTIADFRERLARNALAGPGSLSSDR